MPFEFYLLSFFAKTFLISMTLQHIICSSLSSKITFIIVSINSEFLILMVSLSLQINGSFATYIKLCMTHFDSLGPQFSCILILHLYMFSFNSPLSFNNRVPGRIPSSAPLFNFLFLSSVK